MAGFNIGITVTFKNVGAKAIEKADKNVSRLGKTAKRTTNALKGLRLALVLVAANALVRVGKGLVQTIGKLQLMFVRLSVVEGGAQAAKKSLDQLFKTFGSGPFSIDAVADSLIRLRSAGVDKNLASRVVEFGADAIAAFGGTSEELRRFSIGIQQVAGKGVLSMEELRQQIGEALPVAMRVFAVESGRSISQVIAAVEKGEIASGEFIELLANGLEKEFGGFSSKLGSTVLGSLQGAKSQIQKAFLDTFVTGGNDAAARLTVIFKKFGEAAGEFIRNISPEDVGDFFNALSAGAKVAIGVAQAIVVLAKVVIKLAAALNSDTLATVGTVGAVGVIAAKFGLVGARLFGLAGPVGIVAAIAAITTGLAVAAIMAVTGIEIAPQSELDEFDKKFNKGDGAKKSAEGQSVLNKAHQAFINILDKDAVALAKVKAEMKDITEGMSKQRDAVQGLNKTATQGAGQLAKFVKKVEASVAGAALFPFVKKAQTAYNRLDEIMLKFLGSQLEVAKLVKKQAEGTITEKELKQLKQVQKELAVQFELRKKTQALVAKERGIGFAKALIKANETADQLLFKFRKMIGGVTKLEAAQDAVNREYDSQVEALREVLNVMERLSAAGGFEVSKQKELKDAIARANTEREKALARTREQIALDAKILQINSKIAVSQVNQNITELQRSTRGAIGTLTASEFGDQAEDRKAEIAISILDTNKRILDIKRQISLANGDPAAIESLNLQKDALTRLAEAQQKALEATTASAMAAQQMWSSVRDTMVSAAEQGLKGLITGTKTFKEITREAFDSITNAAIKYLIELIRIKIQTIAINALSSQGGGGGNAFVGAIGAAFAAKNGAAVTKFANGGISNQIGNVVQGPTMFGLAGEAGPEGILPLANVGGKLGVNASGGGGDTFQISVSAIDTVSGLQFLNKNKSGLIAMLRKEGQLNNTVGRSR